MRNQVEHFFNGAHKVWIWRVWDQRKGYGSTWWECMRAHIGLSLGLWDPVYPDWNTGHTEIAGTVVGEYMTDYGMGAEVEILHVRGFYICVTETGTM